MPTVNPNTAMILERLDRQDILAEEMRAQFRAVVEVVGGMQVYAAKIP